MSPSGLQGQGKNLTIYCDPVNGSDTGPHVGDQNTPCLTIGKALDLMANHPNSNAGQRSIKIVTGGTVQTLPPSASGSFGTEGLFVWGVGQTGLDATPMWIEAPLTDEYGDLHPSDVTFNVITVPIPVHVAQDQLVGMYVYSLTGGDYQYTIIGNTANGGGGGSLTITLQTNPGEVYPLISDPFKVGQISAIIQLPDAGEYRFDGMQLGLKNIGFDLPGGEEEGGASLIFRACRIWCQGLKFHLGTQSTVSLDQGTYFEGDANTVYEEWDGIVSQVGTGGTNPFSPTRMGGVVVLGDGTGSFNASNKSRFHAPLYNNGVSYLAQEDGEIRLQSCWFAGATDAVIAQRLAQFRIDQLGTFQSQLLVQGIAFDDSDGRLVGVKVGGFASITLLMSKLTLINVSAIGVSAPITDVLVSIIRDSFCRYFNTDALGTNGVAYCAAHLVANYAAIVANANPPADAGGITGNDPAGNSTNCRIEQMTSAAG